MKRILVIALIMFASAAAAIQSNLPLNQAARDGNLKEVKRLIEMGADPNDLDNQGTSALTGASGGSSTSHTEIVRYLVAHGADVNKRVAFFGTTALNEASFWGNIAIARVLLDAKAEVNSEKTNGFTPLLSAAGSGHSEIVKLLITAGADLNHQSRNGGNSALHIASGAGHHDIVKLLLAAGARADIKNSNGETYSNVAGRTAGIGLPNTPNKTIRQSVESYYSLQVSKGGIGADQQAAVTRAFQLISHGDFRQAESILDDVLKRFATLMSDSNKTYVCFRQTEDYQRFLNETEAKQGPLASRSLTRVHDAFAQALGQKAFIVSSRKQWDQAISYLDKKMSYAPYESQPHIEKGYILNSQGEPQQALESYSRGYALAVAQKDSAAKHEQAMALRGIGAVQIDLGKLDDAVKSFKKSLEIEPGNKVALKELQYIEQVRAGGR